MEQEPVYVPSNKLRGVCESVLGRILDVRQHDQEQYVMHRVRDYNARALRRNAKTRWFKWLGIKPSMLITPHGMEMILEDEIKNLPADKQGEHPVVQIHRQYAELEHQTKDCMVQCALNETVAISAGMARGISHLGLPLDFLQRARFGFYPR